MGISSLFQGFFKRAGVLRFPPGEMLHDAFFRFHVPFDDDHIDQADSYKHAESIGWVGRLFPEDEWAWIQLREPKFEVLERCSQPHGRTLRRVVTSSNCEVFGWARISPFVPNSLGDEIVLSRAFYDRLAQAPFTGLSAVPCTVTGNQSSGPDPSLVVAQFNGRIRYVIRQLIGAENCCPHCGKGRFLCEECGDFESPCPACEQIMAIGEDYHRGWRDKRIKIADEPYVLDGRSWDGQDFLADAGSGIVTGRVVRWLMDTGVFQFWAEPCRVAIEGLSADQRDRIEAVRFRGAGKGI